MRIMIKGGVWKNTEDEILKAAVMKYGLNQWARISSLLVRKSAKQCKARWYEWLDPSIKKTEWTREEDEKLLHLAKLMPCQWRTIAPIVGRTPAQCLERYDKLLDMAVSKDDRYDPLDDPRRLRPGEIDPNPESKPARPDPVDMDEDEKEMLSEARARLANTRGKKAKRKAREKALEEARRLAMLQKKRELQAAGIQARGMRRRRGPDYNNEVVFEHKPAPGFFDTTEEQTRSRQVSQEFRPAFVEDLDGNKRRREIEEGLMKHDIKRQKVLENHNANAINKVAELNDPVVAMRRHSKLMLPAPQLSEHELEQLAGIGDRAELEALAAGAGGDATRQLLGNYQTPARLGDATPLRTPLRTPAPTGGDRVLNEALNLARLQNLETPLAGGDNAQVQLTDFAGATPSHLAGAASPAAGGRSVRGGVALPGSTPRLAATPHLPGATPGRGGVVGPMRTPIRDELGLNEAEAANALTVSGAGSKAAARARQASIREELAASLSALPAPQNEYQVMVPEMPEDEMMAEGEVLDAADLRARAEREAAARAAAEEKKKSTALQRQLPVPASLDLLPELRSEAELAALPYKERAEQYLLGEMNQVLTHDHVRYTLRAKLKKDKRSRPTAPDLPLPVLQQFEEQELKEAALLVAEEVEFLVDKMGQRNVAPEEYLEAWLNVRRDLIYLPQQKKYGRAASATNSDRLDSIKGDFEGVRAVMEREARRAAKLEQKVGIVVGGLQQRDSQFRAKMEELFSQLQNAELELACFGALKEQELLSAPARLEHLHDMVQVQSDKEAALQERFKSLMSERAALMNQLKAPQQQAAA